MTTPTIINPTEVAGRGQKIYDQKFKENFVGTKSGQFAVIELNSERAFVAPHPEEAIHQAQQEIPGGVFHLIKIGSAGAYKVSYTKNARSFRLLPGQQSGC
jgi:hypothetical protein